MSRVNIKFLKELEPRKGKIIGFDRFGYAGYGNESGFAAQALTFCECCGAVISPVLEDVDICPVCAISLGIVEKELALEICKPEWKLNISKLGTDKKYTALMENTVQSFKRGIAYGIKNSRPQMNYGKIK